MIKLQFSWKENLGSYAPHCESGTLDADGICLLSSILLDDGGLGIEHSVSWLREGIERIDLCLGSQEKAIDWSRETFGALLNSEVVKVYSLHDESRSQQYSVNQFRTALSEWLSFIQESPSIDSTRIVELDL